MSKTSHMFSYHECSHTLEIIMRTIIDIFVNIMSNFCGSN